MPKHRSPSQLSPFVATALVWAVHCGLGLAGCTSPDRRMPAQSPAPKNPIVTPVIAGPQPPPPPRPPPAPPTDAASFLEADLWNDPRAYERLCASVSETANTVRKSIVSPSPSTPGPRPRPTPPASRDPADPPAPPVPPDRPDPPSPIAELDRLAQTLDPTHELMRLTAAHAPVAPIRDAARACASKLAALRASLFSDAALYRTLADSPHSEHPRVVALLIAMRRAGAHLPVPDRDRLALLQQELVRLTDAIAAHLDAPAPVLTLPVTDLGELTGLPSSLTGLPSSLTDLATAAGLPLRWPELELVQALAASPSVRDAARAARLSHAATLRPLYAELLTRRHEAATLLGSPTWGDFVLTDTRLGTADALAAHLSALATFARRYRTQDDAALLELAPGPSLGDLDHALVQLRRQPNPTHIGPWPHRALPPSRPPSNESDRPGWALSVDRATRAALNAHRPWGEGRLDDTSALEAQGHALAAERNVPLPFRATGLTRQLMLATFALEAHRLAATTPPTPEALDRLYAELLQRFELDRFYPPNEWPAFHPLATASSYHLVIEALLQALSAPEPLPRTPLGADSTLLSADGPLARWLTWTGPAPISPAAPPPSTTPEEPPR